MKWKCSEGSLIGLPIGADVALKRMRKGERSLFRLAPELGYSPEDRKILGIESTEIIEMDIDLKDYKNVSSDVCVLNCEQLYVYTGSSDVVAERRRRLLGRLRDAYRRRREIDSGNFL